MGLLKTTLLFINQNLLKLSWLALLALLLLLFFGSWLLMFLAGEPELAAPQNWFYFFVTSATTVGYGDFSPQTTGGKLTASFLLMPGGVVVFAGFLGKLSSFFVEFWRRNMKGKGDYSALTGHIVILGWHPERTPRMIELIFGDTRRKERQVVLCATEEMDNPFPDQVLFIQGKKLCEAELLTRAGVTHADRVIIYRATDDMTLTSCLSVAALTKSAHIVAWFEQEHVVKLLQSHCPQVECHTSISMEMLVRSAQDPGSSRIQGQLLSTLIGPTQYSVKVPEDFGGVRFSRLLEFMKKQHEAIVLGVAETATGDDLVLNPNGEQRVTAGQLVYYMSAERIRTGEIRWCDIQE
ncbi:potassium channel family protein [Endozoicomonas sp. 4G]|uniref:potassium channel family protein n=1 Tax=Endozoicomonas sp. 4G TaxID=2872754 RepID=UPI002078551B|nr:potassium channel family protein [Endozoicomonas sp. 4G]